MWSAVGCTQQVLAAVAYPPPSRNTTRSLRSRVDVDRDARGRAVAATRAREVEPRPLVGRRAEAVAIGRVSPLGGGHGIAPIGCRVPGGLDQASGRTEKREDCLTQGRAQGIRRGHARPYATPAPSVRGRSSVGDRRRRWRMGGLRVRLVARVRRPDRGSSRLGPAQARLARVQQDPRARARDCRWSRRSPPSPRLARWREGRSLRRG